MVFRVIAASILSLLALSGCSYQQTLDAMVTPARQGEIVRTAELLCSNIDALQGLVFPAFWQQMSADYRAQILSRCPAEPNTIWQLTNYEFSSSVTADGTSFRSETVDVVAGDADGPWTVFNLTFQQANEPAPLLGNLTLERFESRPESLATVETWDSVRYVVLAVVVVIALIPILLIVWLIRRRRRRKMAGS